MREAAYKFVFKCAERYANSVRTWFVVRGLNAFNHFGFNFEQVLEMTRAANMAVKAASEKALKIIEVANPWGEYYAALPDTIPPLVYVDMVVQSGINFDGFGLADVLREKPVRDAHPGYAANVGGAGLFCSFEPGRFILRRWKFRAGTAAGLLTAKWRGYGMTSGARRISSSGLSSFIR